MSSPRDLVDLYATLGRQVLAQSTTDGALTAVTRIAVAAIPVVAFASITRDRDSSFQTLGPTHPDASINDRAQYELRNGPCLDAVEHEASLVSVPDIAHDPRYPVFGPVAARNGVASMLAVRMVFDDDDLRASLNLYSREPDAFDDTAQTVALVMATHGALAVSGVVAREHAANLERALANSRNIGMALGILMATHKVKSDDAFTLLRIASQTRNRKVVDIAADVVATGTLELPHLD